jgi:glutathione S-transferase
MRRLFLTNRSPYARKVQIYLKKLGLEAEEVVVDLANRSPEFVAISPVGKVPVLVDGEEIVWDSTVIVEYLQDRYGEQTRGWKERLAVRQIEDLGDSLADQAIAIFFGRQSGMSTAKAEGVLAKILDRLERVADSGGSGFCGAWSVADASVLSALGYLSFRLGDGWKEAHPKLADWYGVQDEAEADTRPRM